MLKLFRFLKPFGTQVAAIIALVFCGAMADLYLPTLMSDIIDKGVMSGDTAYILGTGGRMLMVAAAGMLHDGLGEPLPDRNSGLARGFPCGVADFRPHTFDVPRDALPHALTQTSPARTNP